MSRRWVVWAVCGLLAGCAGGPGLAIHQSQPVNQPAHLYKFNDQTYNSSGQALAAMDRFWEETLKIAEIQPMERVAQSLLFCQPSDAMLSRPPYHNVVGGGTVSAEVLSHAIASNKKQFEHRARLIEKAALFAAVSVASTEDCIGDAQARPFEYALESANKRFVLTRVADRANADVTASTSRIFLRQIDEFVRGAGAQVARAAPGPSKREPVIVAVFEIQDESGRFETRSLAQLTEYLAARLAETGDFRVIPREQLRQRMAREKSDTYRACFDQACQIELGKAVAAQKTLSAKLLRVGDTCALTATLYDLKSETTERGASARTGCAENDLIGGVDRLIDQLCGPRGAGEKK